jgi:hypothetical protein
MNEMQFLTCGASNRLGRRHSLHNVKGNLRALGRRAAIPGESPSDLAVNSENELS